MNRIKINPAYPVHPVYLKPLSLCGEKFLNLRRPNDIRENTGGGDVRARARAFDDEGLFGVAVREEQNGVVLAGKIRKIMRGVDALQPDRGFAVRERSDVFQP